VHVAEANGSQSRSGLREFGLVLAQLRDMLAAEDSAVVAKEDHHGGMALPQRAQSNFRPCDFGQDNIREPGADRFHHCGIIRDGTG